MTIHEGGGNYSVEESISIDHARRFCSAAITERQPFALTFEGRKAFVHGPARDADKLRALIEKTNKE